MSKRTIELFLLSALSLYAELLVIWWLSSDIRAFSVFRTFPLVACFVGLGLGFAAGGDRHFREAPIALLLSVFLVKLAEMTGFCSLNFPSASIFNWQWSNENLEVYALRFSLFLIPILGGPLLFMVCIGARLGVLFQQSKPLTAYSINILGALVGSLAFTCTSSWSWPPWARLLPAALTLIACLRLPLTGVVVQSLVLITAVLLSLVVSPADREFHTYWSPYQRLDALFGYAERPDKHQKPLWISLNSNRASYQSAFNSRLLDRSQVMFSGPALLIHELKVRYGMPFLISQPRSVLIIGSGLGNDVAEALKHRVESIDAVDIDPEIIKLGRQYNAAQPYQSPQVTVFCDDARSFFGRCRKRYDLIIFSHVDSHVVTGQGSSARIDNYVYTKESVSQALTLLKPQGLLVISFNTAVEWFRTRLFATLTSAAGYEPLVVVQNSQLAASTYFVLGNPVRLKELKPVLPAADLSQVKLETAPFTRPLSDDWPFLYLAPTDIDLPYLTVVLQVLLICLWTGRKILFVPAEPIFWQMFFLGSAFMLLELQSIARLSLLFGSTWQTSAVVINGVLVMILLANLLVSRFATALANRLHYIYAFIIVTLVTNYLLPLSAILQVGTHQDSLTRLLICAITVLPILGAGIAFAVSFTRVQDPGRALAFNLLGAVAGALLEYLSNYLGIRSLLLIAAVLYLGSYASARSAADQEKALVAAT